MTTPAMRIGIRVPQYGCTWGEIRAVAEYLDRSGVDALWVNDHLQSPGRIKSDPTFDAFTTLSALAPLTHRVRLGIAVMAASYRPPQLAAKMASVLNEIANGRLIVGLGTGSDQSEHAAYGFAFGTPRERTELLRSALEIMGAMWDHPEGANLAGALHNAPNLPQPRRPPVWIAAHGPVLLRRAGRSADGIIAAWSSPEELRARAEIAHEAATAAGRPPLRVALYTLGLVAQTTAELHRWVAPQAQLLGSTPAQFVRWLGTTGLVGTPEQIRERLDAYAAAGATDLILALPERVPIDAFAAVAESLAPAVATPASPRPRAYGARADANLVHLLVGRQRSAGAGTIPAVIDAHGEWTYDELWAAARSAAGALEAAGVRQGGRVAIALRDGREWVAAFLGVAWLGAVAVPVDPLSPSERVAVILGDCEPHLVVAEAELECGGWPSLAPERLAGQRGPECAAVHPEDLAYMIYSSGSTGRPKGVMHAHRDMIAGVETYARHILQLGPGERCHSAARLFTSLGFGNGFFRILGSGATAVLSGSQPNPRTTLELVARHRVRVLTGVPTFWAQLVEYLRRHPQANALAGVRLCVASGDSLPAAVWSAFTRRTGVPLIEGLGCSECSNVVISSRPGDTAPGSLGGVVPGVEISLRDPEGHEVRKGAAGRLWIRSGSNTSGYWRRSEATHELVFGEWIRMGDVLVEQAGRYRHVGRVDDLFKVDARWVSPGEVEACLLEHPLVREAAVGGIPDASGLVHPVAWVTLGGSAPDDLATQLRRHVAHRLAPYMAPRVVTVRDELPRLPSGKLDRKQLRDTMPTPAD